jgi:hypothetical protein
LFFPFVGFSCEISKVLPDFLPVTLTFSPLISSMVWWASFTSSVKIALKFFDGSIGPADEAA